MVSSLTAEKICVECPRSLYFHIVDFILGVQSCTAAVSRGMRVESAIRLLAVVWFLEPVAPIRGFVDSGENQDRIRKRVTVFPAAAHEHV